MSLSLRAVKKKFPEAYETVRGNGTAYVVNCWKPHRGGGIGEMEISPEGIFHCHNCGHSGSLYEEFPSHFSDSEVYMPWVQIKEGAISSAPVRKTRISSDKLKWSESVYSPGETVSFASLPHNHPAVEYLASRGFDIEELRHFSNTNDMRAIYYCTIGQWDIAEGEGSTSGRIVFPIYMEEQGVDGRMQPCLKGWQARYIDKKESDSCRLVWNGHTWKRVNRLENGDWADKYVPKYYTCPGTKKTTILGGLPHARFSPDVAIVEGPLDYYKTGRSCVYTLGKGVSAEQARLIKLIFSRAFLLMDPEVNIESSEMKKSLANLAPMATYALKLSGGKDPGASTRTQTWSEIATHVGDPTLLQNDRREVR